MANAGDELYRLMHDEDKIDIPKSKTRKQKKKDTEGGHMKKPTFQGNNDLKVTDGFHRYPEVCSPSQIKNPDTGEMEDCHENIAANGRTMECIEKLVAWREEVYGPITDRYPTEQQCKAKHDKVKAAAEDMFKTFDRAFDTAIPYMHAALHCKNILKRDTVDCSAESLEHENKMAKFRGQFASKWRPSEREDAQQFRTSGAGLCGRVALDETEAEYGDLPISDDHRRALLEVRKRKTADLTQEQQDQKQKRKFGQLRPS